MLGMVYDGSTTASFSVGAFAYENDFERSNMTLSGLKIDGIALEDGAFA
jgi:hypothetical protein